MTMPPSDIALIRTTFGLLLADPERVTSRFYETLFRLDPDLRPLFRGDLQTQGHKLMAALTVAVQTLHEPWKLIPILEAMGDRHAGYGVCPRDYSTVGAALMQTLEAYLGAAFTEPVREAWADLYSFVAANMIEGGVHGVQLAA